MQRTALRLLIIPFLLVLAACISAPDPTPTSPPPATQTATLVPTSTAFLTAAPTTALTPDSTDETAAGTEEAVLSSPLVPIDLVAPLRIDLPEGWLVGSAVVPDEVGGGFAGTALYMEDEGLDGSPFLPFTIYKGPVSGGNGYITVVWGFRNITTATPLSEQGAQVYLRGDGIRLLNLAVIEAGCTVGYDVDREFMVGNVVTIGTYFAAEDCPAPEIGAPRPPNVRGWFAVTQQSNINFAFYAYTEPAEAMEGEALNELQAILDTVVFDMSLLPDAMTTEEAQP